QEFLEAARARLAPGGIYAQWFHAYESDTEVMSLVLRTYSSVFPYVSVWYTLASDMLLLGFDRAERALDVAALEARFGRSDFAAGFARVGIDSFAQLVAHELLPLGSGQIVDLPGEVHTLRHPILSYRAARSFFRGRVGSLPPYRSPAQTGVSMQNSLLRLYAQGARPLPESIIEAAAYEACRFEHNAHCATFFALWSLSYPQSPTLQGALEGSRGRGAEARRTLSPSRLAEIKSLFSGASIEARESFSALEAEQLTESYRRHYHHVVPFERRLIDVLWDRCRGDDCETRRAQAESLLGLSHGGADSRVDDARDADGSRG
ncbi:MAG TPA: hypothetical protein VEC18_06730, partial [Myxococcota bacterium]|nr:hypothetical protein [Myxococcota bacterium]